LARIPERIGGSKEGGFFLRRKTKLESNIHEVERYLNVIRLLGIEPSDISLEFWINDEDRAYVNALLRELGVSEKTPLVGINPFTTWRSKSWDLEKFANLIGHISDELQLQMIVTGPKDGVDAGMKLEKLTKVRFFNAIGRTDIFQLGALIEKCWLYISPDSAPMHIAAAVKTPTIALFGATSPLRHAPYGKDHIVIEKELSCRPCYKPACNIGYLCMKRIEVIEVIKAIQELLPLSGYISKSNR
jgi:ADP-heptose:LPS heptosyltransferase